MLRKVLIALAVVLALVGVGGVTAARVAPDLEASGPTSVEGTEATAVFTIAERTVRQVRYDDEGTLAYTFTLTNRGRVPVTVTGLAPDQERPRLFHAVDLSGADGGAVGIGAGESVEVTLRLGMRGCETLSSRSGSFFTEIVVRTSTLGVFHDDVTLTLPEELHTGSAREAFCPKSTATSRPVG